jgi:predicted membrane metal-binding protein
MSQQDLHENLKWTDDVKSGSNKSFGLVFAVVFALIGLWPLLSDQPARLWALGATIALVLISFFLPQTLAPFNRVWFLFGLLLHKIVSPIIMALLFYTTVTPIGLIMRLLGKRPLPLEFDPEAKSYWIEREPPGPEPETMTRQF